MQANTFTWFSVVILGVLLLNCNPETQYRDNELVIDATGCLGAAQDAVENTCRTQIDELISNAEPNACILIQIGSDDAPRLHYIPGQWRESWFDIGEVPLISVTPGERISAELYLLAQTTDNIACDENGIRFETNCDDSAPWCLLKFTQAEASVSEENTIIDFGASVGACSPSGQLSDNSTAEVCDGADNDCDGRIDEAPSDLGGDCETERLCVLSRSF